MKAIDKSDVAASIPYDDSVSLLAASTVQTAIETLNNKVITSASPGFSFGRSSTVGSGTWLNVENVPSNKAGRFVYIYNAKISRVFVSNEEISSFTLEIYSHEGAEINLTLLGSVTVSAARGGAFSVNFPVSYGKQLAVIMASGDAKNVVAGLELRGTESP